MDCRALGLAGLGGNTRKTHGQAYPYDNGTKLLVEGLDLEIVDDSSWKKPDEVRQEIGNKYLEYYSETGHEPHYADCVIRWNYTLVTTGVRIALTMDAGKDKDYGIFYYCNGLNDLKALADKGMEDFAIAECTGFGIYKELL